MRETHSNNLPGQRIQHVGFRDILMCGKKSLVEVHPTSTNSICYAALPELTRLENTFETSALCWQEFNNCTSNQILVIQIHTQHTAVTTK